MYWKDKATLATVHDVMANAGIVDPVKEPEAHRATEKYLATQVLESHRTEPGGYLRVCDVDCMLSGFVAGYEAARTA